MQTFGEDLRRAEHRRYLAERRISYGNAVSKWNMRSHQPVAEVESFPIQAPLSSQIPNPGCPSTGARASLSSAFSWQLGGSVHAIMSPLSRSLSPVPKEMPWPSPEASKRPEVRMSTVPEYEKLQKEALEKAKMASYRVDEDKTDQSIV